MSVIERVRPVAGRSWAAIRSSSRAWTLVVCFAVAGGSIWLARQWGPGQDGAFDSAFYVDGARHLARGEGFTSSWTSPDRRAFDPVTRWAPGFPAMIAAVILIADVPPLTAAAIVLGAAYVACVLLILLLSVELLERYHVALGAVVALLFATQPDTLAALDALLSDLPFAAFALLNTYFAVRVARSERCGSLRLIGFGGCLLGMIMTRYAGALFVPGLMIALGIALFWRGHRLLEVVRRLAIPSVVILAGIGVWIARNRRFGAEPFGVRYPSEASFADLFAPALRGAFSWWHATHEMATQLEMEHLLPAATVSMGCVCLALAFSNLHRAREPLLLVLLPCVSYFILMMFVAARVRFDPIENARFWIPIWPLSFLAVSALIAVCTQVWSRIASVALSAAMTAMLLGQWIGLRRELPSALETRGLLSQRWQKASAALPDPDACRLFVMDVRPFMLHRDLGPTSEIPLTRDDFEAAASQHPSLCVATLSKRLRVSRTAEQRRKQQSAVIDALRADGRFERLGRRAGVTLYRVKTP